MQPKNPRARQIRVQVLTLYVNLLAGEHLGGAQGWGRHCGNNQYEASAH